MLPVKPFAVLGTISVAPVTVSAPMIITVPMGRWPPVAPCPHPKIVTPSPTSTDPYVAWHRISRCDLYYRNRHWRWYDDWCRGHDNRHRSRDSKVDSETNPGICSGDSNSSQGQNCDSLFHNLYAFDAAPGKKIITTGLPFCKKTTGNSANNHKPPNRGFVDEMPGVTLYHVSNVAMLSCVGVG